MQHTNAFGSFAGQSNMDDEVITISDDDQVIRHDGGAPEPKKPKTNGTTKATARKRMSSFTPKLTPIEVVDLDAGPSNAKPSHPEHENVLTGIKSFLSAIKGYVNDVEHAKIKNKLDKRLKWIESAAETMKMKRLLEKIEMLTDKVTETPLQVFEITKEVRFKRHEEESHACKV